MGNSTKPYGIERPWNSVYLCSKCGGLLYYDMDTKQDYCFYTQCPDYPKGIEIYGTEEADLTLLNSQFANIENSLGQIISTCEYRALALFLLERRRRIVQRFFTSAMMNIDDFLLSNEILIFIQKYKSLGIRKDPLTFKAILQLYKQYAEQLRLIEDLKEGRYLLARKPLNKIFRMKYYDVITEEIWSSYGLINLQSMPDINSFRYHGVIERLLKTQSTLVTSDYGPAFDRLWPFAISAQYLVKRNHSSSLKYQYLVTPTDLANILSIIVSLNSNDLLIISALNLLQHFIRQPVRGRDFTDFISMLSGSNGKVPIVFKMNGEVVLDRRTLLLFFILMHSQHVESPGVVSGQQMIAQHKQQAGGEYETHIKSKLEKIGYRCLPPSTRIAGRDYDLIAISESKQDILLIEIKFRDPSPSSFSKNTLVKQEFMLEEDGLLPQVLKHQERYDLLFQKAYLFKKKLCLKNNIKDYAVRAYFVTKFTPLISSYGDVLVMSEKKFMAEVLQ